MNKTEVIRLRITPELKQKIIESAMDENRTISNYLENLIIENLKKNGKKEIKL